MNVSAVPDAEYLLKYGDPRMEKYPLMKNPKTTFFLVAVYLLFVKVIGPMWMKRRPPYEIRKFMIVYNLFTSALNAWVFFHFAFRWLTKYRLRCERIDFSDDEDALKAIQVCWVFFFSKFLEFADTVFAVLRKKSSQVSKLHVFHHSIAPSMIWYIVKYGPDLRCPSYVSAYVLVATIHPFMIEFICTSGAVFILRSSSRGTKHAEVSVVEKTFNPSTIDPVCYCYDILDAGVFFSAKRLPSNVSPFWPQHVPRGHVLYPFHQLLHYNIQEKKRKLATSICQY
ncbi:Elongation of very long chain fatty acids protein 1 [Araneus ventricosus]|uniref:Elongation of very long chain fatty acids protein n=1 Tax=Araneus ventricosus TaxID=182803 RepID=A0A4Y2IKE0_ARAVE|nr:Elongation of very long chain fatty acids protein 1 [Araneus ventricosus]